VGEVGEVDAVDVDVVVVVVVDDDVRDEAGGGEVTTDNDEVPFGLEATAPRSASDN
jgi:hypothetical protein